MKLFDQSFVSISNDQPKTFETVDWTTKGVLTQVKNQGRCGSCWAFSTTGALESAYQIKNGELKSFSQQQLVDCCLQKTFGCQGCSGAWPQQAMNYVKSSGIQLQSQYPYKAVQQSCKDGTGQKILNNNPWTMIKKGDINALGVALNQMPVSVCVDASKWSLYKQGIFNNCNTFPLDHAVLLVAVDQNGIWKIKNSWGRSWGENGFIRLASGNTCGVAQHALIPNIK